MKLQIDSEEPRGDEDMMALSLHLVRGGVEQQIPVGLHFVLNLKRQEGIWRLNAVTLSATLAGGRSPNPGQILVESGAGGRHRRDY